MKLTKRIIALALCAMMLVSIFSFSTSAAVTPFRVNVSRLQMGDVKSANVGTYFVFDGQETQLSQNQYSRAVLADWDATAGAYKITASLGYDASKTSWDIPKTGFALMISAMSDGNGFDQTNSNNIGTTNFGYGATDTSKDNFLAGSYIYLYNIDLGRGTVDVKGTESDATFTSNSYVMIGAKDTSTTVQPYSGTDVSITRIGLPDPNKTLRLSHFKFVLGTYGENEWDDIYDQCYVIIPTDYKDADDLATNALNVTAWAGAVVLEKDADGNYKVIHTAKWIDKTSWAYEWLTDAEGNILPNRIVLVCHVMNSTTGYGSLTYAFGQLNAAAMYNGFDPANTNAGGNGTEGAFFGKYAMFTNVDFNARTVKTAGTWGTADFSSESYVVFSDTTTPPTESISYPDGAGGTGGTNNGGTTNGGTTNGGTTNGGTTNGGTTNNGGTNNGGTSSSPTGDYVWISVLVAFAALTGIATMTIMKKRSTKA